MTKLSTDSFKETLGENSYVWAWILKHKGDKIGAKKILNELYLVGSAYVLSLGEVNQNNELSEMQIVQEALLPMSTPAEAEMINGKMQKMKIHISNLPDMRKLT